MIKAVLFDMDGVLIDSFEAWFFLFNKTLEHFGFKKVNKDEFTKECWGISSNIIGPKYLPGVKVEDAILYYQKHFLDFKDRLKIMPGVVGVLEELRKKGIKTAVITNTPHKQTEDTLKAIGLLKYFEFVIGYGDVEKGKPAPDMLFKACKDLGISTDEAIFVGDTIADIEAGRNAGVLTIGFKIDGDKRVDDVKEILSLL